MKNGKNHSNDSGCPELDRLVLDEFESLQRSVNRAARDGLQAKQASGARAGKAKADVAYLKDHLKKPVVPSASPETMDPQDLLFSQEENSEMPIDETLPESDASPEDLPETSLFTVEEERFLAQIMARLKSMTNKDMLISELWRRVTSSENEFFTPDEAAGHETAERGDADPQDESATSI